MTEHDTQKAFMNYVRYREASVPELQWLHAVPNGGARNAVTGARMKSEGTRKGIWDICWPYPRGAYNGLFLEFKHGKNKLTPEQDAFGEFVRGQGYKTEVAYTVERAIEILEAYIDGADQAKG